MNSLLTELNSSYDYHCQFGGPLGFGHDFRADSAEEIQLASKMTRQYKEIRHFLLEDYYPLFDDLSGGSQKWDGWQFHDPKKDEGFFLIFRPEGAPNLQETIKLKGLVPEKRYLLTPKAKSNLPESATGDTLMNGVLVTIDTSQDTLLVLYQ